MHNFSARMTFRDDAIYAREYEREIFFHFSHSLKSMVLRFIGFISIKYVAVSTLLREMLTMVRGGGAWGEILNWQKEK